MSADEKSTAPYASTRWTVSHLEPFKAVRGSNGSGFVLVVDGNENLGEECRAKAADTWIMRKPCGTLREGMQSAERMALEVTLERLGWLLECDSDDEASYRADLLFKTIRDSIGGRVVAGDRFRASLAAGVPKASDDVLEFMAGLIAEEQRRRRQDATLAAASAAFDQEEPPRGLYQKYIVKRTDGRELKGGRAIVLELGDLRTWPALHAYAWTMETANPELARCIRALMKQYADANPPAADKEQP